MRLSPNLLPFSQRLSPADTPVLFPFRHRRLEPRSRSLLSWKASRVTRLKQNKASANIQQQNKAKRLQNPQRA